MLQPNVFTAVLTICDMVHDIEWKQVSRYAHNQYLTMQERELRDTLLDLLEPDFPGMVNDYRELNRTLDDQASKIVLDEANEG